MIRPEALQFLGRWSEAVLVIAVTIFALWIVGAPRLSFGWTSIILSVPIVVAGVVWLLAAIRRALAPAGDELLGRVFLEERRVLYLGGLANIQFSFDDVQRIELAHVSGGRSSLLFHLTDGPPANIPLSAEGAAALVDGLTGLPGFSAERLAVARSGKRNRGALIEIWARG